MKIWNAFGTEHSMNLVMIGRFKSVSNAENAKRMIDRLTEFVINDDDTAYDPDAGSIRFSEAMRELLRGEEVYHVAPAELDQFRYEVDVQQHDREITITTDEVDISAFLKILIDRGARVEVYSAHDYPNKKDSGEAGSGDNDT